MNAKREVIDVGLLTSQIEDTDLGVGNTTVEPGLRVGLSFEVHVSIHSHPCLVHLFPSIVRQDMIFIVVNISS